MESLLQYITLYSPAVIAVLSEVGVVAALIAKITSYFKKAEMSINNLKESPEYKELKLQMISVLKENNELKKDIKILMEKLTHVKVQDETLGNNETK